MTVALLAACFGTAEARGQDRKDSASLPSLPSFYRFPDGQYILADTFRFAVPGTDRVIVVPAGFVTDFASLPKVVGLVLPKETYHDLPSLVHDYLYWSQGSKPEADWIFEKALLSTPMKTSQAASMASAVYTHGDGAWRHNCEERSQGLPRIVPPEWRTKIPLDMTWKRYRAILRDEGVKATLKGESPPEKCVQQQ